MSSIAASNRARRISGHSSSSNSGSPTSPSVFDFIVGLELVGVAGQLFVPFLFEVVVEVVVEIVIIEVFERIAGAGHVIRHWLTEKSDDGLDISDGGHPIRRWRPNLPTPLHHLLKLSSYALHTANPRYTGLQIP